MMSASPDSKLENGEAGQSTMDTITIPKVPLQAPTTKPPEASSSKAGLPGKDATGKKIDSRTGSKTFKKSRFSRLDSFKKRISNQYKTKLFVLILFLILVIAIPCILNHFDLKAKEIENAKKIRVNEKTRLWKIFTPNGSTSLSVSLGRSIPSDILPVYCLTPGGSHSLCLKFKDYTTLYIYYTNFDDVYCYDVEWILGNSDFFFKDGFYVTNAHWYGVGEMLHQKWPINFKYFDKTLLLNSDITDGKNTSIFGNTLDTYWLSSKGVSLYVLTEFPSFFTYESDHSFNIHQEIKKHYVTNKFSYVICVADNIKRVHQFMLSKYFSKPDRSPLDFLFDKPIWSTYAKFRQQINEDKLSLFIENILRHNFNGSYLLIEDGWEEFNGQFQFNINSFPHSYRFVKNITENDFKVALIVYPYFDVQSLLFEDSVLHDYVIRDILNETGALLIWRNSIASLLDITHYQAIAWFINKTLDLKETYNINSILLRGTAINHLISELNLHMFNNKRSRMITQYTKMINETGEVLAVTSAWKSQHFPFIIQISLRVSSWTDTRGLRSIIPTVLTLGILGYPYILPSVIGGATSDDDWNNNITKPDRDLYLRWFQLAICMPFMEISNAPWDYDDDVLQIAHSLMDFRHRIILPKIRKVISEAIDYGYPIIRPIWWISPLDEIALTANDEFLIGDKTLVSPILHPNTSERNIYLPNGLWFDELREKNIYGPTWVTDYTISYAQIAYFTRIN